MPTRQPRPDPLRKTSSSSSSSLPNHIPGTSTLTPLFAQLTFFVIAAKLESSLGDLYNRIEELGGKCVALEEARLVITALRGRPRLERALGPRFLNEKTILSVDYVNDTYETCLSFVSSPSSSSSSLPKLPPRDKYSIRTTRKRPRSSSRDDTSSNMLRKDKIRRLDHADSRLETDWVGESEREKEAGDEEVEVKVYDENIKLSDIPRLAVQRPSPLQCPNQDIIEAIKPIYLEREFEEREQKNSNVLSYRRSMSILKSVPRRLTSGKEALRLVDVGDKVAQRIDEFLTTGQIEESQSILNSTRYKTLTEFSSIFTIGAQTATQLYDKFGCRTLEDVKRHYAGVDHGGDVGELKLAIGGGGGKVERDRIRRRKEGGMTKVEIIDEWLKLKDDLAQSIPRSEVEEIADCVKESLDALVPGCEYTICGGYRRGKEYSNDVDIVFRTPEKGQDVGLLEALYLRLSALGVITHVLHVTTRNPSTPIHATANNFDNLDKAFVIFRLPSSNGEIRVHRRVDLISAPRERYSAAILSWSGSMMFERDLRRYAEEKGFKFRAGLIKASTGDEIHFETEREIFKHLGLRYVPPTLRNADG